MRTSKLYFVLASVLLLAVWGCERKVTNEIVNNTSSNIGADACMECHNDVDGRLQQAEGEWARSVHASGTSIDYTNRPGSDCTRCHDHQGFVEQVTTGTTNPPYDQVSAIHCFTCHAPHSTGTLDLRADSPYTLDNGVVFDNEAGNLCANCHHARGSVATAVADSVKLSTRFGPHHSNQGDFIRGTNGYQYANYTYDNSGHYAAVRGACVGCHMGNEQTHAGYTIGGHSMNMEDEEGNNLSLLCKDCHSAADSYDFTANEDYDEDGTIEGYQTEFHGLMDLLAEELIAQNVLTRTVDGNDTTYAPKNNAIVLDKGITGAVWNFMYLEEDRSNGIHNFKYAVDLIESSIEYLEGLDVPGLAEN